MIKTGALMGIVDQDGDAGRPCLASRTDAPNLRQVIEQFRLKT